MRDLLDTVRASFPEATLHQDVLTLTERWASENYRASIESYAHELIALCQAALERRHDLDMENVRAQATPGERHLRALDSLARHSDPTIRPEGCAP